MGALTETTRTRLAELLRDYPDGPSALISALFLVQGEQNHLTEESLIELADVLDCPASQVYETAAFYSLFEFGPQGRHIIRVCRSICCFLRGGDEILMHVKLRLGIGPEETTPDGRFTLKLSECLALCDRAPSMMIDDRTFGPLTPREFDRVLEEFPVTEQFFVAYRDIDVPGIDRLEVYERHRGYEALKRVLGTMDPEGVVDLVKRSRLHGRGGAAFPTGLKWEFVHQDHKRPKFVVCNAEEGEPGTFKDRPILEKIPHRIVEAMTIAGFAVGAEMGYAVFRGEFIGPARKMRQAVEEARAKGYLGKNILGTGFSFDIQVYRTAGAYICGEESALLEALEGKAGLARIRPPFPVNAGLWARPTALNNVETFANVPDIILNGPAWYQARGTDKFPGTKVYCLAGHVKKPGAYELPAGITLRELIYEHGGGILDDRPLKAVFPGGASSSCLTPASLDVALDYAAVAVAGSMLGSGAIIVIAEGTCMVAVARRLAHFFRHESCGKCIPCREGTEHILRTMRAIHEGTAGAAELAALEELCQIMRQTAFCGLGQAAVNPILSTLKHFRGEYEAHLDRGGCPHAT